MSDGLWGDCDGLLLLLLLHLLLLLLDLLLNLLLLLLLLSNGLHTLYKIRSSYTTVKCAGRYYLQSKTIK